MSHMRHRDINRLIQILISTNYPGGEFAADDGGFDGGREAGGGPVAGQEEVLQRGAGTGAQALHPDPQGDGGVTLPPALVPYMGTDRLTPAGA